MDNIETSTVPAGGDGATSSQDNTAQVDTQPTGTEQAVSDSPKENVGDAPSNPWDSDPRFKGKSAEDIYKAYQEVEKVKGSLSQKAELANIIEQQTGMTVDEIKATLASKHQAEQQRVMQENPGLAALQKAQQIEQQLAFEKEQMALDKFISSDQGKVFEQYKDKIFNAAMYLPEYANMGYDEIAQDMYGGAISQGQQSAIQKIETKTNTQATTAASVPKKSISLADMENMSAEELKSILPHAQR